MIPDSETDEELGLKELMEAAEKHETLSKHLEGTLLLQWFIAQNFHAKLRVADKAQYNLVVKKNHDVLKRIIDTVCCAVFQESASRDRKYSFNLLETEDCVKILHLMRNQDKINTDLVDCAIEQLKGNARIANDIVDAITRYLKMVIKAEANRSTFVSIILNEHGSYKGKSQISVVLRYVCDGHVCERFVGFTNQYSLNNSVIDLPELAVLKLIRETLKQYHIENNFLALSLDGAMLPWRLVSEVILPNKRTNFNYSYFVPWHSHGFGRILLQSLSELDECGLFLKRIDAMENFLQNPIINPIFQTFVSDFLNGVAGEDDTERFHTSPFIIVVSIYRTCFIQFFDSILENSQFCDPDDVLQVVAFRTFLEKLQTVFLLKVFDILLSGIFDETYNFINQKQNQTSVFDNPKLYELRCTLRGLPFMVVNLISFLTLIDPNGTDTELRAQVTDSSYIEFNILLTKISEHLLEEVETRCKSLFELKYCDLPYSNKNRRFINNVQLFKNLIDDLPDFFNKQDLSEEIAVMVHNDIFDKESVFQLMDYLIEMKLSQDFPWLYKLLELILTIPFLPVSGEKGKFKFRDISRSSYIPQFSGIPSGETSVLRIEKELLKDLRNSANFHNAVIARFHEANMSMPLSQV